MIEVRLKDRLFGIQKAILDACSSATGKDVQCGQVALTPRRDKNDNRLVGGEFNNGKEGWPRHSYHQRWEVGNVEALQMDFQWQWTGA